MNPKIGLALCGGGARGFAHLGVIKYLEEKGIKPHILSGTSAGSIAAVGYAMGRSVEDIYTFFSEVEPRSIQLITKRQDGGLVSSTFLKDAITEFFGNIQLEDLPIPTKVVATDFDRGRTRVFDHGPAIPRILASCSIPIVFPPVEIEDVRYVDGGMFKNLPATTIRDYCDILIGSDISSKASPNYEVSVKSIALRSWTLISESNVIMDRHACDILLDSPKFSNYSIYDVKIAPTLFELGYQLAQSSQELNAL